MDIDILSQLARSAIAVNVAFFGEESFSYVEPTLEIPIRGSGERWRQQLPR